MPSFTRRIMATTHTLWQAITVNGSSGRLADLVVQRKSAGSGMAGTIRQGVALIETKGKQLHHADGT
ncbi:hypothetical protein A9K70_20740 [Stenotrophomonas maltophilia]|nr:hypothetical protein A9K70_20740 [Stenotrophomonas maltophilia]